jgi:hypothetical protein
VSVIVNTTVLSNFAAIEQLDLLHQLYGTIHIPPEVYQEIRMGLEEGYRFYQGIDRLVHPFVKDGWIRLVGAWAEEELHLLEDLFQRLHQGEAACLAIAHHGDWLLLTDDLAARQEAERLGIRRSGSVGCLVLAVERDLCSLEQANHWLAMMIAHNYRSPVTDLTPLLRQG